MLNLADGTLPQLLPKLDKLVVTVELDHPWQCEVVSELVQHVPHLTLNCARHSCSPIGGWHFTIPKHSVIRRLCISVVHGQHVKVHAQLTGLEIQIKKYSSGSSVTVHVSKSKSVRPMGPVHTICVGDEQSLVF